MTTDSKETGIALLNEDEQFSMLSNSLYPNAKKESVQLVLAYCKAAQLDVMQKPVHIVPMWNSSVNQLVDVVMPGVGLYRTQAARSKEYGGIGEPEFGPDVTSTIGNLEITYPKWCKITVIRHLSDGFNAEFTAKELWIENYASKKKTDPTPNNMWAKRTYSQLAKCAESQALRKAFPECGAQPTAEEMEGKGYEYEAPLVDVTDAGIDTRAEPGDSAPIEGELVEEYPQDSFIKNLPDWVDMIKASNGRLTVDSFVIKMKSKGVILSEKQISEVKKIVK